MRRGVAYSPQAKAQLEALYLQIASESSPERAFDILDNLQRRCDVLAEFPKLGRSREDLGPGLRTMVFDRRTTIAYKPGESRVMVLAVFFRGQDFEGALRAQLGVHD